MYSVSDLLSANRAKVTQTGEPLLNQGDIGLVLQEDGDWRLYTTDLLDAADPVSPEKALQGEKALALALALSNDQVMDILLNLVRDPNIVAPAL